MDCPVCLELLNENNEKTIHDNHKICCDCYDKLKDITTKCPLCREPVAEFTGAALPKVRLPNYFWIDFFVNRKFGKYMFSGFKDWLLEEKDAFTKEFATGEQMYNFLQQCINEYENL
jgi:hypothetical protein